MIIYIIYLPVTIVEVYLTTTPSFMLLPTREIGELVIFSFYKAHIRKKLHLGPRPPGSDNLNIFSPVTIAGLYSTTSQSFMLLPTREIGELVIFKFYIGHIRKKNVFGPPAPMSVIFKILLLQFSSREATRQLPKVSCFYLHGKLEN